MVRTRFAPSPTGYLHIGGLRTALFAWLYARKHGGRFILRIEDTDQQREVEGAVELIYSTLREAGLHYDEGPDVGGDYGPYVQSERKQLYRQYADELVQRGGAYYCFCSRDDIEARCGKDAHRYDRHCLSIPPEEAAARVQAGEAHVVRQRIPDGGKAGFNDMVYGRIEVDMDELEDGVLLKTDGLPTYNFANVVDDSLMGITHIIRGSEYLSSTPKYNLIYESFGWDLPEYIHVPPVMKDAQRKLSKRYGDASYEDFIARGYLKEAIINYIALLGWSPAATKDRSLSGGDGSPSGSDGSPLDSTKEIFTMDELIQAFDVAGLSKSPAIFDEAKLRWMNAEYIRAMDVSEFTTHALPYYNEVLAVGDVSKQTNLLCRILQPRLDTFGEIPGKLAFLKEMPGYDMALFTHKKMKTNPDIALKALGLAREALAGIEWLEEPMHDALVQAAQQNGLKNGQMFWSLRIAITGTQVTPGGAIEAALLLGRDETMSRLADSMEKLSTYTGHL